MCVCVCACVCVSSNYCGSTGNYGAVVVFQSDLSYTVEEHMAPELSEATPPPPPHGTFPPCPRPAAQAQTRAPRAGRRGGSLKEGGRVMAPLQTVVETERRVPPQAGW